MANTFSQIHIQLVFAVKNRQSLISSSFREKVEKYIAGIVKKQNQKLLAIYCMPDHTHILIGLRPSIAISDLVREIKSDSSKHINEKGFCRNFAWQNGYGAFSYSKSHVQNVVNYILNQPIHHKKVTFREEYIEFLKKFEIEYDAQYLFDWIDVAY